MSLENVGWKSISYNYYYKVLGSVILSSNFMTEGGWSSGHGLTSKGLGGRCPRFETHGGKCLENNFMLSTYTH